MLDKVLGFTAESLNTYFKLNLNTEEAKVIVANLVNQDGSIGSGDENKVILTLLDVEEEATLKGHGMNYALNDRGEHAARVQPMYLNLYLMFAAYFSKQNYAESLKYLSQIIQYFHLHASFKASENELLRRHQLGQLSFELFRPPMQERTHLWSMLGAKHMPSVIYKVRMLLIDGKQVGQLLPGVQNPDGQVR